METSSNDLIQRTLYRLLFDRQSRERALRGDWDEFGLDADGRGAFEAIDFDELEAAASKVLGQLLYGKHGDASGLARCYARSLARVEHERERGLQRLMEGFVASDEFSDSSDVPYAGAGTCPEEAFYRFLLRETGAVPDSESWVVLRHEFLEALLQALTVSPQPGFIVRDDAVRGEASRYWALESYPSRLLAGLGLSFDTQATRSCVLYSASGGHYATGLVPSFVKGWLEHGERERIVATLPRFASSALRTNAERWLSTLCQIGLIR
jgi:hypothetical protein